MFCPCGSDQKYESCCGILHTGAPASSALALMKSRYSAYAKGHLEYIKNTTDPQAQNPREFAAAKDWMQKAEFVKLEILFSEEHETKAIVEFKAHFKMDGRNHVHHERSKFRKLKGLWYYRPS